MYCEKCGSSISDDARFCPECGLPIEEEAIGESADPVLQNPVEAHETAGPSSDKKRRKLPFIVLGFAVIAIVAVVAVAGMGAIDAKKQQGSEIQSAVSQDDSPEQQSSQNSTGELEKQGAGQESNVGPAKEPIDDPGLSLKEMLSEQDGLFVQHEESYYPLNYLYAPGDKSSEGWRYGLKGDIKKIPADATVLKLSQGDKLITTDTPDAYYYAKVIGQGYMMSQSNENALRMGFSKDSEINGVVIGDCGGEYYERVAAILADAGTGIRYTDDFQWVSPEPTSFTLGTYSGTDFKETTIEIGIPYCVCEQSGDSSYTDRFTLAELEKTKDGYFIVDTSSLEPGTYLVGRYGAGFAISYWYDAVMLVVE